MTPSALSDALVLLTDLSETRILPKRTVQIAVARVLAWSWHERRLERCKHLLTEGGKAPPIHVSRYTVKGQTWYVVSDGRHRTVAAREAGRTRISAVVGSEATCHPERYRLDVAGQRLWVVDGQWLKLVAADINTDTMTALLHLGVPYKTGE